jgi:molecular chaperone GrpE
VRIGSTFVIERKVKKKFKNIFKNRDNMTTENTEIDKEMDDVTLDNNASEEQVVADELSVEDQLTQDLAKRKDKYTVIWNLKIIKGETSKERIELYKTANQEVLLAMLPVLDDFDRAMVEILKSDELL